MAEQITDTELLALFREPATKEKAFTILLKNIRRGSIGISGACWWIMKIPMMSCRMYLSGSGMPWQTFGRMPTLYLALPDRHQ